MKSGPCIVFRPGADGALEKKGVQRRAPPPVRTGAVFGIWNDLVQAWTTDSPLTLEQCARAFCESGEGDVAYWRGEFYPAPLSASERRALRAMIEDGSE